MTTQDGRNSEGSPPRWRDVSNLLVQTDSLLDSLAPQDNGNLPVSWCRRAEVANLRLANPPELRVEQFIGCPSTALEGRSRKLLNECDKLVSVVALRAREGDELTGLVDQQRLLRTTGYGDGATSAHLEKPLISKCS